MSKHHLLRYGLAVAAVSVAALVRLLLDPFFPAGVPFITFFFAVMAAAWYGGLGPALVAAVLSTLAADYFFISPMGEFKITPTYAVVLAVFSLEAVGIAFLSGQLHEARREAVAEQAEREQVIDSISDGFVALDDQWRYRLANTRAAEILGKSKEELVGRRVEDLFPDMVDSPFWRLMQEAHRTKKRKSVELFLPSLQRWYEHRLYPSPEGLSIFFTDISEQKQAQEALRETEARFGIMADAAPVLIWLADQAKRCTWFNKPWLDFTGRTMEQGIGDGWAASVHPDDFDRCLDLYKISFDKRQPFKMEYRLRRHDGQYRWVLNHGIPRYAEVGEFIGYIGSCIDVTERKEAEQINVKLAAIVESSDDAIVSKDLNGIITSWNRGAERLFGYTEREAIGRSITMLIPPDRVDEEPGILARIRRGEPLDHYETVRRRKDGSLLDISLTVSPIVDAQGRVVGASKIARDITESKRVEASLRESEARLAGLVTTAMDAIISVDEEQRITLFNLAAEQMFGCTAADAIGKPLDRLIPERYRRAHQEHVTDFGRTGVTMRRMGKFGTIYGLRANGEEFPLEASISHLEVKGHKLFTVILRDITRRVQDERALRESEERLRVFASQLEHLVQQRTHELVQSRDRLRGLATELNLTEQRERKRLAADLHDHLAQMLVLCRLNLAQVKRSTGVDHSSLDMIKQTDAVLGEALTYTRTLVADLAPPVLHDLGLPAALKWLSDYMQRYDLSVRVEVPEEGRMVRLLEEDAVLLFQSARELLINCHKYADTNEASLSLQYDGGRLRIEVGDRGKGFDPVAAFADDQASSTKFGLFSIRERMRALGGSFEIQSAPGKGTTATLTLPLAASTANDELGMRNEKLTEAGRPPSDHSSLPIPHSSFHQQDTRRIRVLLVDDHAMVRQGLRSVLETYPDVEVVGEAGDGEEAVEGALKWHPAVIVMDINMPKMNGIDAAARIKARHPDITIIGLSVNAASENQSAMLKAGAARLLTKEAAVEQLYESIQSCIASARTSAT